MSTLFLSSTRKDNTSSTSNDVDGSTIQDSMVGLPDIPDRVLNLRKDGLSEILDHLQQENKLQKLQIEIINTNCLYLTSKLHQLSDFIKSLGLTEEMKNMSLTLKEQSVRISTLEEELSTNMSTTDSLSKSIEEMKEQISNLLTETNSIKEQVKTPITNCSTSKSTSSKSKKRGLDPEYAPEDDNDSEDYEPPKKTKSLDLGLQIGNRYATELTSPEKKELVILFAKHFLRKSPMKTTSLKSAIETFYKFLHIINCSTPLTIKEFGKLITDDRTGYHINSGYSVYSVYSGYSYLIQDAELNRIGGRSLAFITKFKQPIISTITEFDQYMANKATNTLNTNTLDKVEETTVSPPCTNSVTLEMDKEGDIVEVTS